MTDTGRPAQGRPISLCLAVHANPKGLVRRRYVPFWTVPQEFIKYAVSLKLATSQLRFSATDSATPLKLASSNANKVMEWTQESHWRSSKLVGNA